MFWPPRGPKTTKFVHQWVGPLMIVEPAGYENVLSERGNQDGEMEQFIAQVSFLISYHYPVDLLQQVAADLKAQLEHEKDLDNEGNDQMQARLLNQRRRLCKQPRVFHDGETRVKNWWNYDGDDVTKQDTTCLNSSNGQYDEKDELRPMKDADWCH
ncbi:Hypothetical protein PHPALM_36590 [Phytophthora palmivora]|uniref:Uncharacterized protein n=1 Tax=Phytophthora palmivora TaxID=4796 RepID=A0A2P4WZK7_9STRA|nr:Hypothetical protein PHPALM_36590 [Phytophthora palmivora]